VWQLQHDEVEEGEREEEAANLVEGKGRAKAGRVLPDVELVEEMRDTRVLEADEAVGVHTCVGLRGLDKWDVGGRRGGRRAVGIVRGQNLACAVRGRERRKGGRGRHQRPMYRGTWLDVHPEAPTTRLS